MKIGKKYRMSYLLLLALNVAILQDVPHFSVDRFFKTNLTRYEALCIYVCLVSTVSEQKKHLRLFFQCLTFLFHFGLRNIHGYIDVRIWHFNASKISIYTYIQLSSPDQQLAIGHQLYKEYEESCRLLKQNLRNIDMLLKEILIYVVFFCRKTTTTGYYARSSVTLGVAGRLSLLGALVSWKNTKYVYSSSIMFREYVDANVLFVVV